MAIIVSNPPPPHQTFELNSLKKKLSNRISLKNKTETLKLMEVGHFSKAYY
jgi:hypothetical protein